MCATLAHAPVDRVPINYSANPGIHARWIEHQTGGYWDFCDFPLQEASEDEVMAWALPNPDDYDYASLRQTALAHPNQALYIGGAGLGDCLNGMGMIRNYE